MEADILAELRGDGIDRISERGADFHRAREMPRIVARAPPLDCHRLVDDHVVGLITGLERGEVDEQFPRPARMAHRSGGAVVNRRDVILAAPHISEAHTAELQSHMRISYPVFFWNN